jgi:hypothetical protein
MKALVFLLLSATSLGLAPTKTGIYIDCTCEDAIGALYATALRDVVANSPRYRLARFARERSADYQSFTENFVIHIVTVDINRDRPGVSTAISVAYSMTDIFLGNSVQTCGRERVQVCAETTLADADGTITKVYAAHK